MKKKKIIIISTVALLLVLIITFGLTRILKKDKKNVKTNETVTSETAVSTTTPTETTQETTTALASLEDTTAEFNITIPEPLPDGYYITMGCSLTYWMPINNVWEVTKVDDTHYKMVIDYKKDLESWIPDPQKIIKDGKLRLPMQYKWTLQRRKLPPDKMWSMVEISKAKHDIQNRTVIMTNGKNVFNDEVGLFKQEDEVLNNEPTVVGQLNLESVASDGLLPDQSRTIRVWLPQGYDANDTSKRYPVLYMHDGQNVFDNSTSFAGEWKVDETITDEMSKGYGGCIVVGIDSVDETRMSELSPPFTKGDLTGENYAKYIVEKVKPYVDGKYNTKPEREFTGIGGSSMGGAMSFYMGMKYSDIFGYEVCFSPALVYWEDKDLEAYMKSMKFKGNKKLPKIFVYAGGIGIGNGMGNDEASLTRYVDFVKDKLIANGYPKDNIKTLVDENAGHSEDAWSKYFKPAFEWLVGISK